MNSSFIRCHARSYRLARSLVLSVGIQTRSAASALPENLTEMQIPQLYPRPIYEILIEHSTVIGDNMVNHLKARLWRTEVNDFIVNMVYHKTLLKICKQWNNYIKITLVAVYRMDHFWESLEK